MLSLSRRALPRLRPLCRAISTPPPAAVENNDVAEMDALLRLVRDKSDPTYHNVVPMRSPVLWSETLLRRTLPAATRPAPPAAPAPELAPRNMHDSYTEFTLAFAEDPLLLEAYTNASGGIRTGMLMEHLDSLAGSIAYKHMLGPALHTLGAVHEHGFYIVTASVDRLDMLAPLTSKRDLRLSGQVIHTGHSSMEIAVKMEAVGGHEPEQTVLIGRFSMVCRSAATHTARPVPPLLTTSPQEEALRALGEQLKRRRAALAQASLARVPPSSAEAAALHTFYLARGEGREDGEADPREHSEDTVWMGDTQLEKCMLMFPQERNVHQKIFGGYLMRLAYELGVTNASLFTRGPVRFVALDGIRFARPVPIGSVLRLRSQVLHSARAPAPVSGSSARAEANENECKEDEDNDGYLMHVRVRADVVDVPTGRERTTNDFRFTWGSAGGAVGEFGRVGAGGRGMRHVVPRTYKEAMLWLEGMRALELGAEIRAGRAR